MTYCNTFERDQMPEVVLGKPDLDLICWSLWTVCFAHVLRGNEVCETCITTDIRCPLHVVP